MSDHIESLDREGILEFLSSGYEQHKDAKYILLYTPMIEPEVQQSVIAGLAEKGCQATPSPQGRGMRLKWRLTKKPQPPAPAPPPEPFDQEKFYRELDELNRKMKFDDFVTIWAVAGPIVGIIYGAIKGDVIHGFLSGSAVGFAPITLILMMMPFMLIYEKFFEKH